jgi:protein-disulfide isomerase
MAKKVRSARRPVRPQPKKTNWPLIVSGTLVGAVVLFALLFLALREPELQTIAEYCAEYESACVSMGAEDAPITIVEVSDYGCGHCRDFNLTTGPVLEEAYVATGQVKWVVLPYALRAETMPAAEAAMCANEQDAFFPYHRALFELQTSPLAFTREGYLVAAETAGISDMAGFANCLDDGDFRSVITANRAIASENNVNATPTFFLNDLRLQGNQPLESFQRQIASFLGS